MPRRPILPTPAWFERIAFCNRGHAVWVLALVLVAAVGLLPQIAFGQDDEEDKPIEPKDVTITTRDGISLAATYYASKLGKDAVPVILLHGAKGRRGDFKSLALRLQEAGHAVIAPDLRGHGDSGSPRSGDRTGNLRPADLTAMVTQDIEAVKNYLIDRNNEGELNIEKLCLVGTEMGSVVALNFAARDWSWPPLATGKQGQDVKGLVLISPEWSYRGLRINDAVAHPRVRKDLSVIIVVGKRGSKQYADARRLFSTLERFRPTPPPEELAEKQTLWLRALPTSLQGADLLNEKRMGVPAMIEKFIEVRLVGTNIRWQERHGPLE